MFKEHSPKILIIENQLIIAADVSLQFSKLGYEVIGINTSVADAMKTIENNRPDIILMSIGIQENPNGLDTACLIMDKFQIPVVFLSSNTDKNAFKRAIEVQPYAFIPKPFDKKDLQRGIETALGRMAVERLRGKQNKVLPKEGKLFIQ
jgi:AmiR/NasT family two-component response regulator